MNRASLKTILFFVCLLIATASNANAGDGSDNKAGAAPSPSALALEKQQPAKIGRFETKPVIDGKLDDEVWKQAVVLKDFLQIQPGDNIAPAHPTEVLLGTDGKYFYIGFKCFDQPDKVRATVPKRDNIFDDDYVGAYLDTFNDQRRAYVVFFNPGGIQADGIFTEDRGEDYSVDIVMESKGVVGPDGYTVEVAIPYKSLRYESGKDKFWGAHFFRRTKRDANELDSWMPVSRDRSGSLIQAGRLTGFEEISAEHTLEIIPSITISESGHRIAASSDGTTIDGSRILNKPLASDIGFSLKYTLTPTVTLDLAINPDFAQVEADQLVVTSNQRFPIFFPERRPFFLEGLDYFQTTMNVVNTRTIVDPDIAVKLTGKQGRNTFGLLLASDNAPGNYSDEERNDPNLLPSIARFLDKNSYVGVLRLKHDVGKESNIGFYATSYNFIERHNQVGGFDGKFRFNPKTYFSFQTVGTTTRGYFFDPNTGTSEYRTGNGVGYFWEVDHTDRKFGWNLNSVGRTQNYRANVGFTRRVNTNGNYFFMRLNTDPKPNSFLINVRGSNFIGVNYDWQGRLQNWNDEAQFQMNFKRETFVSVGYNRGHERIYEEEFGQKRSATFAGTFFGPDSERGTGNYNIFTYGGSTISKKLNFFAFMSMTHGEFDYDFGAGPKFPRVSPAALADPNAPLDPGPGRSFYLESTVTVQPIDKLRTTIAYTKSKLTRLDNDRVAFDDNIVSIRSTYQFTPFWFARVRVDFDSISSRMFGQYLLGWAPNPGTSFYVGYNDDLNRNGYNPITGAYEPGVRLNNRTFFVKMSYLFRKSL